jgi:hypothetical protein
LQLPKYLAAGVLSDSDWCDWDFPHGPPNPIFENLDLSIFLMDHKLNVLQQTHIQTPYPNLLCIDSYSGLARKGIDDVRLFHQRSTNTIWLIISSAISLVRNHGPPTETEMATQVREEVQAFSKFNSMSSRFDYWEDLGYSLAEKVKIHKPLFCKSKLYVVPLQPNFRDIDIQRLVQIQSDKLMQSRIDASDRFPLELKFNATGHTTWNLFEDVITGKVYAHVSVHPNIIVNLNLSTGEITKHQTTPMQIESAWRTHSSSYLSSVLKNVAHMKVVSGSNFLHLPWRGVYLAVGHLFYPYSSTLKYGEQSAGYGQYSNFFYLMSDKFPYDILYTTSPFCFDHHLNSLFPKQRSDEFVRVAPVCDAMQYISGLALESSGLSHSKHDSAWESVTTFVMPDNYHMFMTPYIDWNWSKARTRNNTCARNDLKNKQTSSDSTPNSSSNQSQNSSRSNTQQEQREQDYSWVWTVDDKLNVVVSYGVNECRSKVLTMPWMKILQAMQPLPPSDAWDASFQTGPIWPAQNCS